jgi:hypothetical protein
MMHQTLPGARILPDLRVLGVPCSAQAPPATGVTRRRVVQAARPEHRSRSGTIAGPGNFQRDLGDLG